MLDDLDAFADVGGEGCVDPLACCAVADQLSPSLRTEILVNLCLKLLEPYKRNFAFVTPSINAEDRRAEAQNALANIDRRFFWLKRTLNDNDAAFSE